MPTRRQVVFIQGGGAGAHDEWDAKLIDCLRAELADGYEVRYPRMPLEDDPSYARWSAAIAHELAVVDDGAVVVGHSVGGTILINYLAADSPDRRLGAIVLIAAPFVGTGGWPGDEFELPQDLGARLPHGVPVHLFHGLSDHVVPPEHADLYSRAIPEAQLHLLPGRDHQLNDDLSEVAQVIARVTVDRSHSTEKAAALLALHSGPGFVLPNAWDAGSARVLERAGFPAIATTSAGIAWSCGVPDGGGLDRDTMLAHLRRIVAAVGVPVTADLESGYGNTPDEVGRTVARAIDVGAVGANLEDAVDGRLFEIDEAADRIAAARAAAPAGGFVLNARTDTYFAGTKGDVLAETVERATRYVEAGADCIFVPGVAESDTIRRIAGAIPGPLNIVAGLANTIDAPTLFSLGVKRVSLGGSLARAALSTLERAARELHDSGTLGFLDGAIGYADVQRLFRE